MAASPYDFARFQQETIRYLAIVMDRVKDIEREWFDEDFATSMTDYDVAALNLTKADVVNGITLCQNINKLFNDEAPTQAQYSITVNDFRRGGNG